jgi:hypothetical protein
MYAIIASAVISNKGFKKKHEQPAKPKSDVHPAQKSRNRFPDRYVISQRLIQVSYTACAACTTKRTNIQLSNDQAAHAITL